MAKKVDIGPKITLEGEKEFRKALTSINSDMRVLGSTYIIPYFRLVVYGVLTTDNVNLLFQHFSF